MGGHSSGSFNLSDDGTGIFHGKASLENNGEFSMVQYNFKTKQTEGFTKFCIKLKGDDKPYQFRIKTNTNDDYSYVAPSNLKRLTNNYNSFFKYVSSISRQKINFRKLLRTTNGNDCLFNRQ